MNPGPPNYPKLEEALISLRSAGWERIIQPVKLSTSAKNAIFTNQLQCFKYTNKRSKIIVNRDINLIRLHVTYSHVNPHQNSTSSTSSTSTSSSSSSTASSSSTQLPPGSGRYVVQKKLLNNLRPRLAKFFQVEQWSTLLGSTRTDAMAPLQSIQSTQLASRSTHFVIGQNLLKESISNARIGTKCYYKNAFTYMPEEELLEELNTLLVAAKFKKQINGTTPPPDTVEAFMDYFLAFNGPKYASINPVVEAYLPSALPIQEITTEEFCDILLRQSKARVEGGFRNDSGSDSGNDSGNGNDSSGSNSSEDSDDDADQLDLLLKQQLARLLSDLGPLASTAVLDVPAIVDSVLLSQGTLITRLLDNIAKNVGILIPRQDYTELVHSKINEILNIFASKLEPGKKIKKNRSNNDDKCLTLSFKQKIV